MVEDYETLGPNKDGYHSLGNTPINQIFEEIDKMPNPILPAHKGIYTEEDYKNKLAGAYINIFNTFDYYMDLSHDAKNIAALWIIGTYYHENFNTFPYLFVNAMRGSGKTRFVKIIEAFAKQAQLTMSITDAVMFRTTGTLILDEFEGINRKGTETLKELLNSAYKKGTKVFRMKKKKTMEGESQVVEEFQPYRPIVMANIWGMEEVLGDRCITTLLEKSLDSSKTKLVENFAQLLHINETKDALMDCAKCSLCSVVTKKNIHTTWNEWVKQRYTLYTLTTLTTQTTPNYTKEEEILRNMFTKIDNTKIDGRYLELFFPLFLIAFDLGDVIFDQTLKYAENLVNEKRLDEMTESKDVAVYTLITKQEENKFVEVSQLTTLLKFTLGEGENEWLTSKWMGRALKRLNLVIQKRRTSKGMEVMLNIEKAKLKEAMFK